MDFSIFGSGTDIGTLALGLILTGVLAGLAAGTLGICGGLLLVPTLYVVLSDFGTHEGSRMAVAAATGLVAMGPTAALLLLEHHKKNEIDWAMLKRLAPVAAIGAALGSAALCIAPGIVAVIAFAVVAALAAVLLIVVKDGRVWLRKAPGRWAAGLLALMGSVSGTGISPIAVPGLTLSRVPPRQAGALGTGLDAIAAIVAAIVAIAIGWGAHGLPENSLGYVNVTAFAVAAPTMFLATVFTAPYAVQVDASRLRKLCAAYVLFCAGKMIWTVVG